MFLQQQKYQQQETRTHKKAYAGVYVLPGKKGK